MRRILGLILLNSKKDFCKSISVKPCASEKF